MPTSHSIEIKEGAFFVADAHYSKSRPLFLDFLKDIASKKLEPSQLILMGDIFDALFGQLPYTHTVNKEAVELLNLISKEIEVIYLEGNHDFNLKDIFPHAKVFPIAAQPVECSLKDKKVLIAHGDIESPMIYRIYAKTIRNPFVLYLLRFFDSISSHAIYDSLERYLQKKEDCKEFVGLQEFMSKRLGGKYECDFFVEGHFHQNKTLELRDFAYINLGAFACNQRYFIVEFGKSIQFLNEKNFSKGN